MKYIHLFDFKGMVDAKKKLGCRELNAQILEGRR